MPAIKAANTTSTPRSRIIRVSSMNCSTYSGRFISSAEAVRRQLAGEQKHLHHSAAGENLDDSTGLRLNLRGSLAHFHSGDPLDFLSKRIGSGKKQLPVKVLYFGRSFGALRHRLLGRRQCAVQRDHECVPAEHYAD